MLYLIKQESKNNTYYKIGYAKDISERMKTYKNHNAEFELIDTFEGTIQNENIIHNLLKEYKLPDRNEWYYYDENVLKLWNLYKQFYFDLKEVYNEKITKLEKENKNLLTKLIEYDNTIEKFEEKLKYLNEEQERRIKMLEKIIEANGLTIPSNSIIL